MEYLIFETRLCVEITKFQSELTKLQRTERCETQNIQRQFSFPSTNLFVTVAERQQNTTTTQKKEDAKKQKQDYVVSVFFWGLSSSSLHMAKAGNDKAQCVFCVCGNHPRHAHTHTHTHVVFTLTLRF